MNKTTSTAKDSFTFLKRPVYRDITTVTSSSKATIMQPASPTRATHTKEKESMEDSEAWKCIEASMK